MARNEFTTAMDTAIDALRAEQANLYPVRMAFLEAQAESAHAYCDSVERIVAIVARLLTETTTFAAALGDREISKDETLLIKEALEEIIVADILSDAREWADEAVMEVA
ncbi:hypothetical protein GN330_22855 [Nitratireductor sp. CAU 1489]|uniref:Uncharacterized protein n=1 Tax=Nitratireductor arenosus TaxID=2682096 RepID=A0A844QR82_9HYPH|nr:hypothetical protein [Nitratireductor arenosus]MVB00090.1 hypothetical protein [Nitratireductor arenosus]